MKPALVKLILQHIFLRESFKDEIHDGLITYDMCFAWVDRYYPGETSDTEIDGCLNELNIFRQNKPNKWFELKMPERGTCLRAYTEEYYKVDAASWYCNDTDEILQRNILACDKFYGDKVISLPRDHDRYCLDCMTRVYGARRHGKKNNKKHTKEECRENMKNVMTKFVEM